MTNEELERICRSWAGHLATTPGLRTKANEAKSAEALADLINQTVAPHPPVTAAEVEHLKDCVARIFAEHGGERGTPTEWIIINKFGDDD